MKNHIINRVIEEMGEILSPQQSVQLYDCLVRTLQGYDLIQSDYELSVERMDNDSLLKQFVATKRLENLSEKSIHQYVRAVTAFSSMISKDYLKVTTLDIKFYLSSYATTGVSNVSVNNERRYLSAFFNWLTQEDYITKNPVAGVKNVKCTDHIKTLITDDEVEKIRDCCENLRDIALVDTLISTGMRVSELCALNRNDIDFVTGEITIYASKTKSYRTGYLSPRAKKHLQDYFNSRDDDNPAVFVMLRKPHERLNPHAIEDIIHALAKSADIDKNVTVHTFRRYMASTMFRRGCDLVYVSKLLGHANTATTEKFYLVLNQDKIKEAHATFAS